MKWLLLFFPLYLCSLDLTLEEKIGQMLMVHVHGDEADLLIREAHVGAVIYYRWANNLDSPEEVRALSARLQQLSPKAPLFIAIDQEGGRVTRLTNGFSFPPPNKSLGDQGQPAKAEKWAETVGRELKSVGINMNLAPVVDVNTNPDNPVIGDRSYSHEPWEVVRFGSAALKGYEKAGIMAVLKHFPGHGDTSGDSHTMLPVVNKEEDQLNRQELLPFKRLASQAKAMMTAHILVPALDPKKPATLSKPILNILRDELHFDGIILTDSLVMEGILKAAPSLEEVCLEAIEAGCDILLLGGKLLNQEGKELKAEDVLRVHRALVKAVQEGRISKERIDQSVSRILKQKSALYP